MTSVTATTRRTTRATEGAFEGHTLSPIDSITLIGMRSDCQSECRDPHLWGGYTLDLGQSIAAFLLVFLSPQGPRARAAWRRERMWVRFFDLASTTLAFPVVKREQATRSEKACSLSGAS
jgi:hypothetical protein